MTNPNSMQAMREKTEAQIANWCRYYNCSEITSLAGAILSALFPDGVEPVAWRSWDNEHGWWIYYESQQPASEPLFTQPSSDDASAKPYEIHSCSSFCERPECVKDRENAQLRQQLHDATARLDSAEKDADRYRMLRRGQRWSIINGFGEDLRAEALDERIDAAIAAQAGKGGAV